MNPGWQFKLTGWPWWLVLPLAALAVWALLRLHGSELLSASQRLRTRLLWLRGVALTLLVLFLLEPSLSRRTVERALPLVGVLVDQSSSMNIRDEQMSVSAKLSEAVALNLLPAGERALKGSAVEQAVADKTLVTGAGEESKVSDALAALSKMSRYERAAKLAQLKVLPALENKARVNVYGMDTAIAPLDPSKPDRLLPNRATDFASAFSSLSRTWAQEHVGGVVLLSDGRQTAGADPVPVIRSLRARGAKVGAVLIGDPGLPPDAALAEISGTSEVFPGESIPLTVRFRIAGSTNLEWDLVLSHDGKEVQRRTVKGKDHWDYETFTVASTNIGMNLYQARLELARDQSGQWPLRPTGSVDLEVWRNQNGSRVDDFRGSLEKKPDRTGALNQLSYANQGPNYGARIRGFLIPDQNGSHVFWISSDDASEFWLSPSEDPAGKTKICAVTGYVPSGKWDGEASQKSQPITLKARQPYYFEVLHKQGGGEDHLSVGWQLPDNTMERPIPRSRLAAFAPDSLTRIAEQRKAAVRNLTNEWREASLANNSAEKSVAVNRDPIKVLLVDSTPRWESRYLSAMFERDRRVNFTRRYHSVIIDDRSLRLLPQNQAEWDAYDMVVAGDLDSNELPEQQQVLLANFVARRGGFLICVAGPRGMPKAFSLGTLANFLPVRVSLQTGRETEPVTAAMTPDGGDHPVMQVLNDPAYNQKLWPMLPPLQWVADFVVAKPGASVLLVAQNPARAPLVALHRYGAGRVFYMGTEESWRWRDRLGERVHQTFWLQVMRWGLAGRLRGTHPELQVGLDNYLMASGETAELKARVSTRTGEPILEAPTSRLERLDESGQPLPESSRSLSMLPMSDAPGLWHLTLANLAEGRWRITTSHQHPELNGISETREISVRNRNALEELELGGDLAGLHRMAAAGGLRAGTADECETIVREFASGLQPRSQERRHTLRLWNNYVSMIIVMTLLCTEWVLRKRHGLA